MGNNFNCMYIQLLSLISYIYNNKITKKTKNKNNNKNIDDKQILSQCLDVNENFNDNDDNDYDVDNDEKT